MGNGHDLIELVGNEDDGHALLPNHSPEDIKELIGLLRGEDGGRLVQNQNVRPPVQGLQNLHPLLQADAELSHPGLRVHPQAILLRQRPDLLSGGGPVTEKPSPPGLPA